jgi:hypothetical protein
MNLNPNAGQGVQLILDFIAYLASTIRAHKRKIPIHIFNVREFGYVCYCYGATTITIPIARSPYIQISDGMKSPLDKRGKYYHPVHMEDYTFDKMLAFSRSNNYMLPCPCIGCNRAKNFLNVQNTSQWNKFRREHYLLVKNQEIREIQSVPSKTLNYHLSQKFSRSKQTVWLAFLDQQPILTFS